MRPPAGQSQSHVVTRKTRARAGRAAVPIGMSMSAKAPAPSDRAEERYRRHADKSWSLTDCHAMEVASERRIRDIATTDVGYEQAGFERLLVP